jgi:hypothetical protein
MKKFLVGLILGLILVPAGIYLHLVRKRSGRDVRGTLAV